MERNKLPVPGLVLFLLLGVMGMTDLGRDDKTAWQVPFSFRGHRVTMASQKFGLRLYVIPASGSEETAEVIARQVVTRLRKALRIVERNVLADYAKVQLDHGRLTIANRAHLHRGMYRHFRDAAVAAFTAAEHPPGPPPGADITEIFTGLGERFRQSQVGAWEAIAAVGAYFSLLEHELVLVSAFADVTSERGALLSFISARWSDKFVNCSTWGMRRRTACISTCTRSRRHTGTRTATAGSPSKVLRSGRAGSSGQAGHRWTRWCRPGSGGGKRLATTTVSRSGSATSPSHRRRWLAGCV